MWINCASYVYIASIDYLENHDAENIAQSSLNSVSEILDEVQKRDSPDIHVKNSKEGPTIIRTRNKLNRRTL